MSTPGTQDAPNGTPAFKMTTKRGIFADSLAKGESVSKAGRTAGYKSVQNAHDVYRTMRDSLLNDFGKVGVTTQTIAQKIKDKMSATELQVLSYKGTVTDCVELEAHDIQLRATELAADFMGLRTRDTGVSIGTVNVLWAGDAPAWAKPELMREADALPNGNANSDGNVVITDSLAERTRYPEVELKVLESDPGVSGHTHSPNSAKTKKRRGPRLPIYKGDK